MKSFSHIITAGMRGLAELFPKETPIYLVGGIVRNAILGYGGGDIDMAGAMLADDIIEILRDTEYSIIAKYPRTGTVVIAYGEERYEYTTFRTDYYPINGSHTPDNIRFTQDIYEDASRRDFRANAIYYDILLDRIVDPLGGVQDISNKVLSTCKSADSTLGEDALRILRLARFCGELGFTPSADALSVAQQRAKTVKEISVERIQDELEKILVADKRYGIRDGAIIGLDLLTKIGVMRYIIPELDTARGVKQNPKYHLYDVYGHTLECVRLSPINIRRAALFHDIAKPQLITKYGNSYSHDVVGEEITRRIMARLKYSNKDIEYTAKLVRIHMFNLDGGAKAATVRRFIRDNYEVYEDFLALRVADKLASGRCEQSPEEILSSFRIQEDIIKGNGVPINIQELDIDGNDLIAIGYKGRQIGETLRYLSDLSLNDARKYTRDELLKIAEERRGK